MPFAAIGTFSLTGFGEILIQSDRLPILIAKWPRDVEPMADAGRIGEQFAPIGLASE